MSKSGIITSAAFLFFILISGFSVSKAAVIYSYVAAPSTVVLNVGSTANVEIYLQETRTDSSTSLLAANGGLFNAGVSIATAIGSSASIGSGNINAAFAGPSLDSVTPSTASFLEGVSVQDNTGPTGIADGNITLVPLASISVQANSIGQTTFDIGEYNALGGNTLDFVGDDLDFDNSSPAYMGAGDGVTTLTVIVPEPMSAAGSLLPIGILSLLRRRRYGLKNACRPNYGIDCLEKRMFLSGAPLQIPASFSAKPTFVEQGLVPRSSTKLSQAIHFPSSLAAASVLPAPFTASQIRQAYGVNAISFFNTTGDGSGQTIAIIDAFNDPNIVSDANFFSSYMGLQQFNVNGGPSLNVLNENGQTALPADASPGTWDVEESLDVEWAHAIAPKANIVLFEANSSDLSDLMAAVDSARNYPGVDVVNMSWGGSEFYGEQLFDAYFTTPTNHQGVTFVGSSGDTGGSPQFPETSPNVLGVAATSLTLNSNGTYASESAWPDSGGGVSYYQPQPAYQAGKVNNTSATNRTSPDVSIDGDPATGVLAWDSLYSSTFFLQIGGTSLAAPLWSGLVAISDQARTLMNQNSLDGATGALPRLYQLPSSDFHDVTTGSNGFAATAGYDLATGLGSPIASQLVPALAGYAPANHLVFASITPPSVMAGNTVPQFTLDVKDSSGNTVTSDNSHVTFTVTGPDGVITNDTTTVTAQNGVAVFSNLSLTKTGNYSITAIDGTLSKAVSSTFTITPAAVSKLVFFQQPTNIFVTGTMTPAVSLAVEDIYSNVVTGNTSTISLAVNTGPGTISGTASAVAVKGVAIFSAISFKTSGSYTLKATVGNLAVISGSFVVTGDKLVITQIASNTIVNATLTPIQVSVEMPDGTLVAQSNASVTISILAGASGAVLSGTTTVNAVNGIATFTNLSMNERGSYILSASNATILSGIGASFEVTDPPAKLVFIPPPTNALAGIAAYPQIGVNIEDAFDSYVPMDSSVVNLFIASGPAGASLSGTTSVAAVNGVATFSNVIFSLPGTYTLLASDGLLPGTISTPIVVSRGDFQLQTLASLNAGFTIGSLITDSAGDLFGLTDGGVNSSNKSTGTIFEIPAGTHSVIPLASFPGGAQTVPSGTLVVDSQGDLFGTMELGGDNDTGSIFELPKGSSNIVSIASFEGGNGSYPVSGLIADPSGNLYGTTYGGGDYNSGVVFEVPANTSNIQVLASIGGLSGGSNPFGGLYRDSNGNLFGTTEYGGSFNAGTIFEIPANGVFKTQISLAGPNGQFPTSALVGDTNGNLYGATDQGGVDGYGTLFEITNGHLTTLLNFTGGNGSSPYGGVVADSHENLFGTTLNANNQAGPGIIYELPHGSSSIVMLATFNGASEQLPYGGLTFGTDGNLYGISDLGGSYNGGAVYELQAPSLSPAFSINGGAVERSMDKLLTLSFPQPANLAPGAITLSQQTTGGSLPMNFSTSSPDGGMTWNITFPSYTGASLPDGVYNLTLIASDVTSVATGMSMTGADQSFTFHRLFGDADGNGTVDQTDYSAFLSSYGQTINSRLYNSTFDYDNNGIINGTDYLQFKLRFGKGLLD